MRRIFIDLDSAQAARLGRSPLGWIAFAPGAALILLGLLIWAMPTLLVALVAGACIAVGSGLLLLAWRLRRSLG